MSNVSSKKTSNAKIVFEQLFNTYGPQSWWPADAIFEVMIGAILTQNTSWINVEKALLNLKPLCDLHHDAILDLSDDVLAKALYPVGYFNIKTKRLKHYCAWYGEQGGYDSLSKLDTETLRTQLLSVNGIGPETADGILLYAFERDIFVIDSYTKRIFSRLGFVKDKAKYDEMQEWFHSELKAEDDKQTLYNEYHALIVLHAKEVCKTKPVCENCCLKQNCPSVKEGSDNALLYL